VKTKDKSTKSKAKKNIKKTTEQYNEFLAESRDQIYEWIDDARVKALFAKDMNKRENAWIAHCDALKNYNSDLAALRESDEKRYAKYLKTPAGQAYWRKAKQDSKKWKDYEEHQKKHGPHFYEDRLPDKHPGVPPTSGFEWSKPPDFEGVDPLAKFDFEGRQERLTVNDYRILLGALHDGLSKGRGEGRAYLICPDLWGLDTFEYTLFRMIKDDSRYWPMIKKALRCVKKDLREKGLLGGEEEARPSVTKKNIKKTAELIMKAMPNDIKGPKGLCEAIDEQLGESLANYDYVKNKLWPILKQKKSP